MIYKQGNQLSFVLVSIVERAQETFSVLVPGGGGGALGYFLGGYMPPGTPNWHPVLKKISPKLIPRSRNGPIFLKPVLEFALKLNPVLEMGQFLIFRSRKFVF